MIQRTHGKREIVKFEGVVTAKRDYEGVLTHLKVHPVRDGEARAPEARPKKDVVRDLLRGDSVYYTGRPDSDGLTLVARLRVVTSESEAYLRSDGDEETEDSLPELPKF